MERLAALFTGFLMLLLSSLAVATPPSSIDARPFPRQFSAANTPFTIYQPQIDSWNGDRITGRFAMSVKTGTHQDKDGKSVDSLDYGVVWFAGATEVDKAAGEVLLRSVTFDKAQFPTAAARQDNYLGLARSVLKDGATFTIDLDQLESALAVAQVDARSGSLPVKNDPPEILFAFGPALLILVDGTPTLKPAGSGVQRVINSRSLLLQKDGRYYTRVAGHWAAAASLAGPWNEAKTVDASLQSAADQAVAQKLVDTLDDPPESLSQAFAAGTFPDIQVRTHAAELIVVNGDPQFTPIAGTRLSFVANTGADVFVDGAQDQAWYVLVSGRWFTAPSSKGPWRHVAAASLPADFAKIPADNPRSAVLASIPGTPEARESLIANSIPQTATVHRSQATLQVPYDGSPQFKAIEGTSLKYAANTPVPVIQVPGEGFYAVDKGIWFSSNSATGPWAVATQVPAAIYSIPTSSPLHYITYVRIYGSEGDEVYVGYTPGYFGTVVSESVVVYGTGYACTPWIGAYWYGCPATYGLGVYFGWGMTGWSFGFGWGWYDPWFGPWGPWWGPWWGPAYPWGWWGGGAAAWNVYGHWGNAVIAGTGAAWANPWTGNVGRAYRGSYHNQRTGGEGAGRGFVNTNAYTGTTTAGGQGVRYNPQTGRAVAGEGIVASNPYTGQAVAAGDRTVVNTNTGTVGVARDTYTLAAATAMPSSAAPSASQPSNDGGSTGSAKYPAAPAPSATGSHKGQR